MTLWALLLTALLGGGGWTPAANTMSDPRWAAACTLLADGRRGLICGGYSFPADRCVATADEFDPDTRRFTPCRGRLQTPRNFASASLLPDGRVLIAGGYNTVLGSLATAELFDPSTEQFTMLPSQMETPRELFSATTLADGRVLIAGGFNTHRGRTQATAEVFDPQTQAFTPTGPLAEDRFGQCAVRLADGRVLVAGGTHWFVRRPGVPLASAEVYDPATGKFHPTAGPMAFARDRPTATLLPDGSVLIAGGQNGASEPGQAERFDPKTETFTPPAVAAGDAAHGALGGVPAKRRRAAVRRLERVGGRNDGKRRSLPSPNADVRRCAAAAGGRSRRIPAGFPRRPCTCCRRQGSGGGPGNLACDRIYPAISRSVNLLSVETPETR